jgi:type IV pilus assembly protein PilO
MAMNMNINFNKIKNLPANIQTLIVSVPSLIIVILFVFLVFLPKYKEINALSARITKLDQEISSSEVMVKKLDILIEENKMLNAKLAKLQEQLPEEKEVSELLRQISESGLQSGLEILLWKPDAKKTSPDNLYVEIPVKVEVKTGYHNLGVFFSHVSRFPRLVNISDLDLRVKDLKGKSAQDFISAAFTARTFASLSPEERAEIKDEKAAQGKKESKGAQQEKR